MEFTTIRVAQKRSQIRIKAKVKYDMFSKELNEFIIKNNIFRVDEGKKFFDYIEDQGPLKFMSEKFKNLIEDNDIKGLQFFPIIIEGTDVKYYYYIENQCNSIYEKDEDGDRIYGTFQVDLDSWDGSDIFYLKDSGATVCTPRVKEIIEKAKITNIEFEDLSNY
jgi:hypothetical protein